MKKLKEFYTKTVEKITKAKAKMKGHRFEKHPNQHENISPETNSISEPALENLEMSSTQKPKTPSKTSSKASIRGQNSNNDSLSSKDYISLHSNDEPRNSIESLAGALNNSDLEDRTDAECFEATADTCDPGEDFDGNDTGMFDDFSGSHLEDFQDADAWIGCDTGILKLGINTDIHSRRDSSDSTELRRPREDIRPLLASSEDLGFETDDDGNYGGDEVADDSFWFPYDKRHLQHIRRVARNRDATASELNDSAESNFENGSEDTDDGYNPLSSPNRSDLQELLHQDEDDQMSIDNAEAKVPGNSRSSSVEIILNSDPPTQRPSTVQQSPEAQHPFLSNSISAPRGFVTNAKRNILQPRSRLPHNSPNSRPDLSETHSFSLSYHNSYPAKRSPSPSRKSLKDYDRSYNKDPRPRLRHMLLCDNCKKMGHRWMHCLDACILCGNLGHGIYACGKGRKRVNEDELDVDLDDGDTEMEMKERGGALSIKRMKWEPETEETEGKLVIYA